MLQCMDFLFFICQCSRNFKLEKSTLREMEYCMVYGVWINLEKFPLVFIDQLKCFKHLLRDREIRFLFIFKM